MLGEYGLSEVEIAAKGRGVVYHSMVATSTISAFDSLFISKRLTASVLGYAAAIKSMAKAMQGSASAVATISTGNLLELSAAIIMSAQLTALRILRNTQLATASVSAFASRIIAKPIAAAVAAQAAVFRALSKVLGVVASVTAQDHRAINKGLTAQAIGAAVMIGLVKKLKTLAANATGSAMLRRAIGKTLLPISTASASIKRDVAKRLTAGITATAFVAVDVTRIVRDYLWARTHAARLWARSVSNKLIGTDDANPRLWVRKITNRIWKNRG